MSKKQSKADRREAARQARIEAQRKRAKARRRRAILSWGVVVVILALLAGFAVWRFFEGRANVAVETEDAGCGEFQEFEDQGAQHIKVGATHDPYNSNPPTSGPHYGSPADWGVYPDPVEPEVLVHNLEHGGIVIHYKDLSEEDIQALEEFVEGFEDGVILNPNPDIESNVAFAAWQHSQTCDRFSKPVAEAFIQKYCEKGPERFPLSC